MSSHNIPFLNVKMIIIRNMQNLQLWDLFQGPKNEFETAVVNEPSVFEPLKLDTQTIEYNNKKIR